MDNDGFIFLFFFPSFFFSLGFFFPILCLIKWNKVFIIIIIHLHVIYSDQANVIDQI
jgi:hypothetical protein